MKNNSRKNAIKKVMRGTGMSAEEAGRFVDEQVRKIEQHLASALPPITKPDPRFLVN